MLANVTFKGYTTENHNMFKHSFGPQNVTEGQNLNELHVCAAILTKQLEKIY